MCAVNCWKVTFTLTDATYPSARAQKCRFCARNARKQGFRRQKKHKNPDFVLESPENGGSEGKKRTKMGLLCAFLFRKAAQCGPRCLRLALGTAQLWSNHLRPALRLASGLVANEPTVCEANRLRTNRLRSRLPTGPTVCGANRLRG